MRAAQSPAASSAAFASSGGSSRGGVDFFGGGSDAAVGEAGTAFTPPAVAASAATGGGAGGKGGGLDPSAGRFLLQVAFSTAPGSAHAAPALQLQAPPWFAAAALPPLPLPAWNAQAPLLEYVPLVTERLRQHLAQHCAAAAARFQASGAWRPGCCLLRQRFPCGCAHSMGPRAVLGGRPDRAVCQPYVQAWRISIKQAATPIRTSNNELNVNLNCCVADF
jgi:hypothetical protein